MLLAAASRRVYPFHTWRYPQATTPRKVIGIAANGAGYLLVTATGKVYAYHTLAWSLTRKPRSQVIGITADPAEGLRRNHDDAAGAKLDAKLIDRFAVNTGTIPRHSRCLGSTRAGGIDASSVEGAGWGGGPVVVRARERACTWRRGRAMNARWPEMTSSG